MNSLYGITEANDKAAIKGREVIYDKGLHTLRFKGSNAPAIQATFHSRQQAERYCRAAGAVLAVV